MKFENDIEFVYGDSFPKEGEVAISDLHLEFFKKMGYINSEKNIKISASELQKDPSKIIGQEIYVYGSPYDDDPNNIQTYMKICSVVKTGLFDNTDNSNIINELGIPNIFFLNKNDFEKFYNAGVVSTFGYCYHRFWTKIDSKDSFEKLMDYLYNNKNNMNFNYFCFKSKERYVENNVYESENHLNQDFILESNKIKYTSLELKNYYYRMSFLSGNFEYKKLQPICISLLSALIVPLILYLANIIPYIRDEITNNPIYFKKVIKEHKDKKFFIIQRLVITFMTFVFSLILYLIISLIINKSIMYDFAKEEALYQAGLSKLFPLTINYLCVLVSLGLSLIISAIGFIFVKSYLKDTKEFDD